MHKVTFLLLVIGGLNWLLYAFSPDYNLVKMLLGSWPTVEMLVYVLVGLSAIYEIFTHKKCCKDCAAM
jgi:uncharacterized protein